MYYVTFFLLFPHFGSAQTKIDKIKVPEASVAPPAVRELKYYPSPAIKGNPVTLECVLEYPSISNITYSWYRGHYKVHYVKESSWTIPHASLDTRNNFTCVAGNDKGESVPKSVFVEVLAPPTFISHPSGYQGYLFSADNISLSCWIECYPLCSIVWYQSGSILNTDDNPLYYVTSEVLSADHFSGDFESVRSNLVWNLTNWPNHQLNKLAPLVNYTCSTTSQGLHVGFTTIVGVEYPPEDLTVTSTFVTVEEYGTTSVRCSGRGSPPLLYDWKRGSTSEIIAEEDTLIFVNISRHQAGNYSCIGSNRHGKGTVNVYINVQYTPDCLLKFDTINEKHTLLCSTQFDQRDIFFKWSIVDSDDNLEGRVFQKSLYSYLVLDFDDEKSRIVQCRALNNLGEGVPCRQVVSVYPRKLEVSEVKTPVHEGVLLNVMCTAYEAYLLPEVRWLNGTTSIVNGDITNLLITNDDGTYTIQSNRTFKVSHWDNGVVISCLAGTEVVWKKSYPPLKQEFILSVLYPPVISTNTSKVVITEIKDKKQEVLLECPYHANPPKLHGVSWFKNGIELIRIRNKHSGGNIEHPSLKIKETTKEDAGEYICELENAVGIGKSETITLDIFYPPLVEVLVEPSEPVKAGDHNEVSFKCEVTEGNPKLLREVRWFLNGELLVSGSDPEPVSLILRNINETSAGKYSCQGLNDAGEYGPKSPPFELIVYYPPKGVKLRHSPPTVVKKGSLVLECIIEEAGYPRNASFSWFKNGYEVANFAEPVWTIPQVTSEVHKNICCVAENLGGRSAPACDFIDVWAPPSFIRRLNIYEGVSYSTGNFSLTCRVECFPLCSILWFKDGVRMDFEQNPFYYVINRELLTDYTTNDLESIESTLVWNMTNWPNHQLDEDAPLSNYTCASASWKNKGPHVKSTVIVGVDVPPEELTISHSVIDVVEYYSSPSVKCSGKGRPSLNYLWRREGTSEVVAEGDRLQLHEIQRSQSGNYICECFNKHGKAALNVYFNVLYKPDCFLEIDYVEGVRALVCSASANPPEVSFEWALLDSNLTINGSDIVVKNNYSYVILNFSQKELRTYQCTVSNSIGLSMPCQHKVSGTRRKIGKLTWLFQLMMFGIGGYVGL